MRLSGMLTVLETAQLLGCAEVTIWRYIRKGFIRKVQVAHQHRVFIPHTEVLRIKSGIVMEPKPKGGKDVVRITVGDEKLS
jgi:predicted site-specific integrase-resolvase